MEMNFGGPVWHASGVAGSSFNAQRIARSALRDVGDARLGEWVESLQLGPHRHAFHLRRRLSQAEAAVCGPVRDVRGTEEERARREALLSEVSPLARRMIEQQLSKFTARNEAG